MIVDPPLLTIRRDFPRPPASLVAALTGAMSGHVVDALGGRAALCSAIKPVAGTPVSFCGTAVTCNAGPADNLAVFGAVLAAKPGDIIVAATGGYAGCSVTGDLLLGMAKNAGIAGFVTDGLVRDIPGIAALNLPCYAAGISPNSPARNGPGTVGLPIDLGGLRVESGDIVLGDGEGVVVVPRAAFDTILTQLADVRDAEAKLEAQVKGGLVVPSFIETLVKAGRFVEVRKECA